MAYGVEKLTEGKRRDQLRAALKRLAESFEDRLLPFDLAASWAYGDILAVARKAGRPMSMPTRPSPPLPDRTTARSPRATSRTLRPPASIWSIRGHRPNLHSHLQPIMAKSYEAGRVCRGPQQSLAAGEDMDLIALLDGEDIAVQLHVACHTLKIDVVP